MRSWDGPFAIPSRFLVYSTECGLGLSRQALDFCGRSLYTIGGRGFPGETEGRARRRRGTVMKRILIEWLEGGNNEPVGRSTAEMEELIANIVETMRPYLRTMQIQLEARPLRLGPDETEPSGAVRINGKKIEAATEESLSKESLTDAVLKEATRFCRSGCAGSQEDLSR